MPYIRSLVNSIVRDKADADDITQEVFIRAYRYFGTFRGSVKFKTWLYRIAVNQSMRALKKRNQRTHKEITDEPNTIADPSETALEMVIRKDQMDRISRMISDLPKKQKAVLLLRVNQDLPFHEIARIMRRSVGAVKANYFHAVQKLQASATKEVSS